MAKYTSPEMPTYNAAEEAEAERAAGAGQVRAGLVVAPRSPRHAPADVLPPRLRLVLHLQRPEVLQRRHPGGALLQAVDLTLTAPRVPAASGTRPLQERGHAQSQRVYDAVRGERQLSSPPIKFRIRRSWSVSGSAAYLTATMSPGPHCSVFVTTAAPRRGWFATVASAASPGGVAYAAIAGEGEAGEPRRDPPGHKACGEAGGRGRQATDAEGQVEGPTGAQTRSVSAPAVQQAPELAIDGAPQLGSTRSIRCAAPPARPRSREAQH